MKFPEDFGGWWVFVSKKSGRNEGLAWQWGERLFWCLKLKLYGSFCKCSYPVFRGQRSIWEIFWPLQAALAASSKLAS